MQAGIFFTLSLCPRLIYSQLPDIDHHRVGAGWYHHHRYSCLLLLLLQVWKNWVSIKSHEVLTVKSGSKCKQKQDEEDEEDGNTMGCYSVRLGWYGYLQKAARICGCSNFGLSDFITAFNFVAL